MLISNSTHVNAHNGFVLFLTFNDNGPSFAENGVNGKSSGLIPSTIHTPYGRHDNNDLRHAQKGYFKTKSSIELSKFDIYTPYEDG